MKLNLMEDKIMLLAKRHSDVFPSLFDDFFGNNWSGLVRPSAGTKNCSLPAVNVKEDTNTYSLEMAAPGLSKDDFKVHVENDVLTISSEKKAEDNNDDSAYTRKEFAYGSFKRSFSLPENEVDTDAISANYSNGVLYIGIPKLKEAKLEVKREISIS